MKALTWKGLESYMNDHRVQYARIRSKVDPVLDVTLDFDGTGYLRVLHGKEIIYQGEDTGVAVEQFNALAQVEHDDHERRPAITRSH